MNADGEIELEIGAGSEAGHYDVRVLRAVAGGEPTSTLKLDVDEVLSKRDLLEATILASAVARRSVSAAERPVRQVGRQLFEALFTGPVYGTYRASMGMAQQRGKRLRVVLRLTAPELRRCRGRCCSTLKPRPTCAGRSRWSATSTLPAPRSHWRSVCRCGFSAWSPRRGGLPPLDVDAETTQLAEALAGPVAEGLVELDWVPEATWPGVHAGLLDGPWHVLHFIGHGAYDTTTDEGVIALVGPGGRPDLAEASRLADLLGEAQPAPQLVVLNSCSSGHGGVNDLFSSTAAALARSGISAVAAMQFTISDTAAIAFARGFYTAIARGRGVDEAARSGRISILGAPRSLEWVTPVLYLRGQGSQLFSLTAPPGAGRETSPGRPSAAGDQSPATGQPAEPSRNRQAELRAIYVEARAALRLEHFGTAVGLFDDLLTLDPDYPDAVRLRDTAQRSRQLANAYMLAAAAQDAGDWVGAARGYDEVLRSDPDYRDAADRKAACELQEQVADLRSELRHHAGHGHWQAVLDVDAELSRLDPSHADLDGLAARARATLDARRTWNTATSWRVRLRTSVSGRRRSRATARSPGSTRSTVTRRRVATCAADAARSPTCNRNSIGGRQPGSGRKSSSASRS